MRRREPTRIGDVMGDFFSSSPVIARKIAEARVSDVWAPIVGDIIASYTTSMEVKSGKLTVALSSSVARNEVFMRRSAIVEAINEAVGMRVVNVIHLK